MGVCLKSSHLTCRAIGSQSAQLSKFLVLSETQSTYLYKLD